MRIGVDLMGSDSAPELLFEGVIHAANRLPSHACIVVLILPALIKKLQESITRLPPAAAQIHFHSINDYIAVQDDPLLALRTKKEASTPVAVQLLAEDYLSGFVSAGNTGALIGAAALGLPKLAGVDRPALLVMLPGKQREIALIDAGGNLNSNAKNLLQYARMGALYQRCRHALEEVRVGLLNIGEESIKGPQERREAYRCLQIHGSRKTHAATDFQFLGNIEARQIFDSHVDVVVTDGFTGNILLKAIEGTTSHLLESLRKIPAFKESKAEIDDLFAKFAYPEHPGALVCGVEGIIMKCHGNASPQALAHTILQAASLVDKDLIQLMKQHLPSSLECGTYT